MCAVLFHRPINHTKESSYSHVSQDKARQGKAWHGMAKHGKVRQGKARQGKKVKYDCQVNLGPAIIAR